MIRKQTVQFSKQMVLAVVLSEILLCVATVVLSCCGFDMTTGVAVIKANIPFAVVVFAAYSGNSAVEKWLVHTAQPSGATAADMETATGSNG